MNHMNREQIHIREVTLEEAYQVHEQVPEFQVHFPYSLETFLERTKEKETLPLVAMIEDVPVGYVVGYDRDGDGSFYCWMAGVDPDYRQRGALQSLMAYLEQWSKVHAYRTLKIKTRNNRREMLSFLMKNGYLITGVEAHDDVLQNRILLQKDL